MKVVMMETLGSHSFELMDVPAIARGCRRHDIVTVIDNTWATLLYFKPLDHGYHGLHTMGVRVERQSQSTQKIVDWLKTPPEVEQMARAFSLVHGRVKRADDFVNFSVRL